MKIAKPILLVTTPLGVLVGVFEGYRLAGGLVMLMVVPIVLFGLAMLGLVRAVRREARGGRDATPGDGP